LFFSFSCTAICHICLTYQLISCLASNWKKALFIFGKHEMAHTHKDSVVAWKSYQATSRQGDVGQMIASANASEIAERREYLRRIIAVTSILIRSFKNINLHQMLPISQNEIIDCCAQEVTNVIVSEMTKSKIDAIMANEARDARSEQLAVCVRYVSEGEVKECFLALTEIKSFDAQSIANELQQQIQKNGVAELKCVAQTYDGAAVMSGSTGGVQAYFRKFHPEAICVYCYANELNLVLCHTLNHHKFIEAQSRLGLTAVELALPAIFECLSVIGSPIAVGLRGKLYKFSTVYALLMFQELLSVTQGLRKLLQKETLDLAETFMGKEAVCDTLRGKRTDAFTTDLYERTKAMCHTHSIPEPHAKKRHKQKKMEEFVLETTLGSGTELISSETLKNSLLFPCVDRMVSELELRFSSVHSGLLKGIQACNPKSENFLSESNLDELARHYSIDLKTEEVLVAKNFLARKTEAGCPPQDMLAVHNLLDPDMFPSLRATIQIALTVPVSSCSCERSFSALRRLHSWLRQTMGQKRLHNLAAMSIENDILKHLSHNRVIDRFATLKNRRHFLMLPPTT
uniref:HAT C-terminal dimerisation domain-containing protein n=1 Tax=Sander lucioperca TaxID=283035 RepID=A0A8C9XYC6_SANLU